MATVRKEDMVRLLIKTFPTDLQTFFLEFFEFLFFRTVGDRVLMTIHAGFDTGHPGEVLGPKIGMARIAFQPLGDVSFVVERNRLLHLRAGPNVKEKKEYDNSDEESNEEFHGA